MIVSPQPPPPDRPGRHQNLAIAPISGWKVVSVQPDQVILQGPGEKRTVQLHTGGAK